MMKALGLKISDIFYRRRKLVDAEKPEGLNVIGIQMGEALSQCLGS